MTLNSDPRSCMVSIFTAGEIVIVTDRYSNDQFSKML